MKPNVTLKKLSEMLNISISTVSRALINHPDISEKTKSKVRELASVLEYEPNTYAINLRTNNSKEFGVIIPAISNYFYQSFLSSLEEEVRKYGYSLLILQSVDDPLIEQENLKRCKQNRVAGVFISITSKTTDIQPFLKLEDKGIPIIFFDKVPVFEAFNKVCVADASASAMAVEALISKGKKNILAIFGDINMSITSKRLDVFKETLIKYQFEDIFKIMHANNPEEAHEIVINAFKKNKPDAIFCMSDEILTGVMKAAQKLKINIPDETGIIAISDGFIPRLYFPEITYAETSGFKLGKLALSRMLSCLAGSSYAQELMIDSILIKGGSL